MLQRFARNSSYDGGGGGVYKTNKNMGSGDQR